MYLFCCCFQQVCHYSLFQISLLTTTRTEAGFSFFFSHNHRQQFSSLLLNTFLRRGGGEMPLFLLAQYDISV